MRGSPFAFLRVTSAYLRVLCGSFVGAFSAGSEGIHLSLRIVVVAHLLHDDLRLLRDHRKSLRYATHPGGAVTKQLEAHAPQQPESMLDLRLRGRALLHQVGDSTALPLEVRESTHSLFTRPVIERIGCSLELVDFLLDRLRRLAGVTQVELRESPGNEHRLPVDGVG